MFLPLRPAAREQIRHGFWEVKKIARWCFQIFLSPLFEEDSHFDQYFSGGLKHQPDNHASLPRCLQVSGGASATTVTAARECSMGVWPGVETGQWDHKKKKRKRLCRKVPVSPNAQLIQVGGRYDLWWRYVFYFFFKVFRRHFCSTKL